VISPFVLGKIGEHAARRYFLTAETMTGGTLLAVALAHEVVPAASLEASCARLSQALLQGEPLALAQATSLIRDMARSSPSERAAKSRGAASRLARLRVEAEAQEGFRAFFGKRKLSWIID
jgi:methylglutaconyl-CoA hydratase